MSIRHTSRSRKTSENFILFDDSIGRSLYREHKKRTRVLAKECIRFGIEVCDDLFSDLRIEVDRQLEIEYAKLRKEPKK